MKKLSALLRKGWTRCSLLLHYHTFIRFHTVWHTSPVPYIVRSTQLLENDSDFSVSHPMVVPTISPAQKVCHLRQHYWWDWGRKFCSQVLSIEWKMWKRLPPIRMNPPRRSSQIRLCTHIFLRNRWSSVAHIPLTHASTVLFGESSPDIPQTNSM